MICPACKQVNPTENLFCGKCGSSLDKVATEISQQVEQILSQRFKDRGLVEYEVTDNLIKRFEGWLKIAAWVFAPAAFAALLAFSVAIYFGFKTYTDARSSIQSAANIAVEDVQGKAKTASNTISKTAIAAQDKLADYAKVPALHEAIHKAEVQVSATTRQIQKIALMAEADQQKLKTIQAKREANPSLPLGQLSPNLVSPYTFDSPMSIKDLMRDYRIGDKGDNVGKIQRSLKYLGK